MSTANRWLGCDVVMLGARQPDSSQLCALPGIAERAVRPGFRVTHLASGAFPLRSMLTDSAIGFTWCRIATNTVGLSLVPVAPKHVGME